MNHIYAGWIAPCQSGSVLPEDCRLVAIVQNVSIHNQPSSDGALVGTVASGRRGTIKNQGENGWVPISGSLKDVPSHWMK